MTRWETRWFGMMCAVAAAACAPGDATRGEVTGGGEIGATAGGEPSDVAPRVVVPLHEVPLPVQAIAEGILDAAAGSEMTPAWADGAHLAPRVAVFHRADVDGPAYYGFAVEPSGHIVVATGPHDTPVPFFSDTGTPPADELLDAADGEGVAVRRLLWLDAVSHVVEDDGGALLRVSYGDASAGAAEAQVAATAPVRRLVEAGLELGEMRALLVEQAEALAGERAAEWQEVAGRAFRGKYKDTNPSLSLTGVKWVDQADLLKTNIKWSQHDLGSCLSGCGPVAWGQYIAYMVENAKRGGKFKGAVPTAVYPHGTSFGSQAKALVMELGKRLDSWCVPNSDSRATSPWNMGDAKSLLSERGATVKVENYWTLKPWITLEPRSQAWIQIAQRQRPAILGMGQFEHYAIGLGSGHLNTTRYIWINQGWGGTKDGWLQQAQLFAATYAVPPGVDTGGGGGGNDMPPQHQK